MLRALDKPYTRESAYEKRRKQKEEAVYAATDEGEADDRDVYDLREKCPAVSAGDGD